MLSWISTHDNECATFAASKHIEPFKFYKQVQCLCPTHTHTHTCIAVDKYSYVYSVHKACANLQAISFSYT